MARDPVADLREIAFRLERALEPTYRVKAFRTAANVADELPDGELEARAAAGTLQELSGIGAKTAQAIQQSLGGNEPDYLRKLAKEPAPMSPAAAAVRAVLQGDLHTHSDWSDGGSPIREMALTARGLGHDYVVLTDHSPRLTVANGLSAERLERQLDVVAELNDGARAVPDPHRHRGRHPRRRRARPEAGAARSARPRGGQRPLEAAHAVEGDDAADDRGDLQPAHGRPRPLHRPADHRRTRSASRVGVRGGPRVRRLRAVRRRGRDQLTSGAAGPAAPAAVDGGRDRLPVLDRHRCARAGSARLAAQRLRARRRVRRAARSRSSTRGHARSCLPGRQITRRVRRRDRGRRPAQRIGRSTVAATTAAASRMTTPIS